MPVRLLGSTQIAKILGVRPKTMRTWIAGQDVPEPCAVWPREGGHHVKLWRPSRLPEWRAWLQHHYETRNDAYVRHRE